MCTAESPTPKARAATWATLVCSPCPISVPPCVTRIVPSVYRWTSAPPWFMNLAVKLMPYLVGSIAIPRFRHLCSRLNASTAASRSATFASALNSSHARGTRHSDFSSTCPKGVLYPSGYMFASRRALPSTPVTAARWSITSSVIIMPCGPPNPRNAVFGGVCVLHTMPRARKDGQTYTLSTWSSARSSTGPDRSSMAPPLENICTSSAASFGGVPSAPAGVAAAMYLA
mmetsp:Transcript_9307/g.22462  ORF Transcript_9307/g.22462 Transcript_9307/m.22462 type:complete len:229 (+) Transcript_9307:1325-2011(+)